MINSSFVFLFQLPQSVENKVGQSGMPVMPGEFISVYICVVPPYITKKLFIGFTITKYE